MAMNNFSKHVTRARALATGLALSVGLGVGLTLQHTAFGQQAQVAPAPVASAPALASPAELSRAFINVAKAVKPAVVHLEVVEKAKVQANSRMQGFPQIPGFPDFGGQVPPRERRGTGSGVIISPDGYILTNNHVAGDADEIKVKLSDGRELKARRVGTDPETDLAVIKVDEKGLPFARLGDSGRLEQGEWVIALGSPFGLDQTMTAGIVSATGRDLRSGPYDNYIQTDASINPGNSGGPLVNMSGEVVGINTMIFSRSGGSQGIGFAVPSNLAGRVYGQLVKNGKVSRGYLGINLQQLTPAVAQSLGYEGAEGAVVGDLAENSPSAKAGLKSGDVIVEFDGKKVSSPKQLTEAVADTPVGKAVAVKYVRDGRAQTATVTLGERPGAKEAEAPQAEAQGGVKLGVSVADVTPELARELRLKIAGGALVQQVQPGSPAAEAGLQRGDVIHRVGRTPVAKAQDLIGALQSLGAQKDVVLQVERNGQLSFVTVTLN
jgi:serine protease Do